MWKGRQDLILCLCVDDRLKKLEGQQNTYIDPRERSTIVVKWQMAA